MCTCLSKLINSETEIGSLQFSLTNREFVSEFKSWADMSSVIVTKPWILVLDRPLRYPPESYLSPNEIGRHGRHSWIAFTCQSKISNGWHDANKFLSRSLESCCKKSSGSPSTFLNADTWTTSWKFDTLLLKQLQATAPIWYNSYRNSMQPHNLADVSLRELINFVRLLNC